MLPAFFTKFLRIGGLGDSVHQYLQSSILRNVGIHFFPVDLTHAWLAGFGKLPKRFERSFDTHFALLSLACAVIRPRVARRRPRRPPPWSLGCRARIGQTLRSDLFTEFTLRTLAH